MMLSNEYALLPQYLPSPTRRSPEVQEEPDYQELAADPKFQHILMDHGRNGTFHGLTRSSPEYDAKLREIALDYVREANERRVILFRAQGILNGKDGAFREAISCYNRALEISSNSPSRHVTLANRSAALIKCHKFAEALEDAQQAASLCGEYSIAFSLKGYCHMRLGMGRRAVVDYHTALQLNPADLSNQGLLEDVKRQLLDSGEALETIEELEAPFSSWRSQEEDQGAVQSPAAATTAEREEVGPSQRRFRDSSGLAVDAHAMMRGSSPSAQGSGGLSPDRLPPRLSSIVERTAAPKSGAERPRLSRKLSSGSLQLLSSVTQLPGKLKTRIAKKNRGHSGSQSKGRSHSFSSDFQGLLYGNVVEDVADAPAPALSRVFAATGSPGSGETSAVASLSPSAAAAAEAVQERGVPGACAGGSNAHGGQSASTYTSSAQNKPPHTCDTDGGGCEAGDGAAAEEDQRSSPTDGDGHPNRIRGVENKRHARQQQRQLRRQQRRDKAAESPIQMVELESAADGALQHRSDVQAPASRQHHKSRPGSNPACREVASAAPAPPTLSETRVRDKNNRATETSKFAPSRALNGEETSRLPRDDRSEKEEMQRSSGGSLLALLQSVDYVDSSQESSPEEGTKAGTRHEEAGERAAPGTVQITTVRPRKQKPEQQNHEHQRLQVTQQTPHVSGSPPTAPPVSGEDQTQGQRRDQIQNAKPSWVSTKNGYASSESSTHKIACARGAALGVVAASVKEQTGSDSPGSPDKIGWTTSGSISDGDNSRNIDMTGTKDRSCGRTSREGASPTAEVFPRRERDGAGGVQLEGDSDCASIFQSGHASQMAERIANGVRALEEEDEEEEEEEDQKEDKGGMVHCSYGPSTAGEQQPTITEAREDSSGEQSAHNLGIDHSEEGRQVLEGADGRRLEIFAESGDSPSRQSTPMGEEEFSLSKVDGSTKDAPTASAVAAGSDFDKTTDATKPATGTEVRRLLSIRSKIAKLERTLRSSLSSEKDKSKATGTGAAAKANAKAKTNANAKTEAKDTTTATTTTSPASVT